MDARKKWILVLEDNDDRRQAMMDWLRDRLGMYEILMTDDPHEFIRCVEEHDQDVLAVSLDHDLFERPDRSTELTGMKVVDYLTQSKAPSFPVLLHTSNDVDGARMQTRLEDHGWSIRLGSPVRGYLVGWLNMVSGLEASAS